MKNRVLGALAVLPLAIIASPVFAQAAPSAAETGVTNGFSKIDAIVNLAVPLMIGIAAVVVAAAWGLKMLKKA